MEENPKFCGKCGAYLIRKYDDDKEKEKSEKS